MKKFGLSLFLTALGIAYLPRQGLAYDFHYSLEETTIINTDLNKSRGWLLSGTVINSGTIKATSSWGYASYPLPLAKRVHLSQGNIRLYWSGFFPMGARTESDKYYLGLQYADNAPVCYDN